MRILIRQGAGPLAAYQAMYEEHVRRERLAIKEPKQREQEPARQTADDQLHMMREDDSRLLRGIPAIGRGVAGAITGTRPEDTVR